MKLNLRCYHTTQPSQGRTVLFPIFGISSELVLLMRLHIERTFPADHAGVLYGLPKVHKTGSHFRPSVSLVNAYNFNLASFLVNVLKPISTIQFTIKDSFTFVDWAKTHQHNNEVIRSFDVCSLFTNVPLDETIEICLTKLYSLPDPPALPQHVLKDLLELLQRKATLFLMIITMTKLMASL